MSKSNVVKDIETELEWCEGARRHFTSLGKNTQTGEKEKCELAKDNA